MLASYLDPIAAGLSVIGMMSFIRLQPKGWIYELIATALKAILYFDRGMYGQVGLKCVVMLIMCYGWYRWKHPDKNGIELPIRSLTLKETVFMTILCALSILGLRYLLITYTDSPVASGDAFITVIALCTKYMLCNKIIEHWYLAFVSSMVVLYVHASVGLPFHAAIHAIYPVIGFMGYRKWKYEMKLQAMRASITL